ncbi:MAG: tetratricopeptide repeat protein [Bryobacteraceae bacterium]
MTRFARMRPLVLLLAALSPLGPAWSQGLPSASNATTAAMMTAGTTNLTVTSAPVTHAAVLLTGRVLLENGSPPPRPAKIERVCNSIPHSEGFTDAQGNFGIHFGSTAAVTQDANEQDRLAPSVTAPIQGVPSVASEEAGASLTSDGRLLDCELRAVLSGYHSNSVPIKPLHLMENPDIGVIVIRPDGSRGDGSVVTAQSLAVPKEAQKLFVRAQEEATAGKTDRARQHLEEAVAVYPQYAAAWCALGKLEVAGGTLDSARASFERAVHTDPNMVDPYLQLATVALWDRRWQEVVDLTTKAIELDPRDYPQLYLYAAVANYNLRKPEAAERTIEQAQALDSRHAFPEIERMAGVILASRKDYAAAVQHLRAYLQLMPNAGDASDARTRLAEAEKMTAQAPAQ